MAREHSPTWGRLRRWKWGESWHGLEQLVYGGLVTVPTGTCFLCGALQTNSRTWGLISTIHLDSHVLPGVCNPLNCDKILSTRGSLLEGHLSLSGCSVLRALLLQSFMACFLAGSYSFISSIHSFSLDTAPSLQSVISLILVIFSRHRRSLSQHLPVCLCAHTASCWQLPLCTLSIVLLLHCSLPILTLFSIGGAIYFTAEIPLFGRGMNWLLGRELLKTHFLLFGMKNMCFTSWYLSFCILITQLPESANENTGNMQKYKNISTWNWIFETYVHLKVICCLFKIKM